MQFIINNLLPISIAVLSGSMLLWSFFGNRIRGIKEVNCVAALQLINHKNALVLDVRDDGEYQAGHILNATSIPFIKFKQRIGELEKHKERSIVVICHSGNRSAAACAMLGKLGFTQAYHLAGGVAAWQKANLPLQK